ncbi:hypothetical protein K2X30_00425 [bacterium]|nr:hypothetical protein [bacterium]
MNAVFYRWFLIPTLFFSATSASLAQAAIYQCPKLVTTASQDFTQATGIVSTEGRTVQGTLANVLGEFPFEADLTLVSGSSLPTWKGRWKIIGTAPIPDFPSPMGGTLYFTELSGGVGFLIAHPDQMGTRLYKGKISQISLMDTQAYCKRMGQEETVAQKSPSSVAAPTDAQVEDARNFLVREWTSLSAENRKRVVIGASAGVLAVEGARWALSARAASSAAGAAAPRLAYARNWMLLLALVMASIQDTEGDANLPQNFYLTERGTTTLIHYNEASFEYFTKSYPWLRTYLVHLAGEVRGLAKS